MDPAVALDLRHPGLLQRQGVFMMFLQIISFLPLHESTWDKYYRPHNMLSGSQFFVALIPFIFLSANLTFFLL